MTRIDHIPVFEKFEFDGKVYVILRQEGNMAEVEDDNGKRWAWPSDSMVWIEIVNDAFKLPMRKAK